MDAARKRECAMGLGAAVLATALTIALGCAQIRAQETQAEPGPVTPAPKPSSGSQSGSQSSGSQQSGTQTSASSRSGAQSSGTQPSGSPSQQTTAAPVVRRQVAHPNAGPTEPVGGRR